MSNFKLFCEPKPDYYFFKNEIIANVKNDEQNWLNLLPVNRAVRIFKRQLITESGNKILAAPAVFTFDNLLQKLYTHLPDNKTVISNELLFFLIEEILKKSAQHFSFLPKSDNPAQRLIKKIGKLVSELRRFGYTAQELSAKEATDLGIEINKLDDFTLILQFLEEILGDRYIDLHAARHEAALNLNRELFQKVFPGIKEIFISGYGLFTPAMYLFIEKVSSFCNVSVKLEYDKNNQALFENTRPVFERLLTMGAEIIESTKDNPLARKLFNRDRKAGTFSAQNTISLFHCDNAREEVTAMARLIHKIKTEDNVPLDKIAITFNPLEKYVPIINRIFAEYKIPFNLSTGYPLGQSHLISTMLKIIDIVNENYEYERVFNVYQSPFINSEYEQQSINLYKTIIKGRIKYLTADWDKKLAHNLKARGATISKNIDIQIKKLKSFLDPFYAFGAQSRNPASFKNDYLKLLKKSGLFEWYKLNNSFLQERQREREFRAFNRYMKILDQFSWALQVVFKEQDIDIKLWSSHLKSAVANAVCNLTEWPLEAVQIMPRLEIQAIDYDFLFLGGMVDGNFPRSSTADIFLNDENRQKMGLLANEDLLFQDRFIFFSLLNSARKKVYLTAPKYSGEKKLVPSSFIDDLKECCSINEKKAIEDTLISMPKLWEAFGNAIQGHDKEKAIKIKKILNKEKNGSLEEDFIRKIKSQHQRLSLVQKAGNYEGDLRGINVIQKFIAEAFKEHSWSITRLEDYAFCPMQYFLKRILKIEELPEFDDEISPLERGNTIHNILFKFYSKLREINGLVVPGNHLNILEQVTQEELGQLSFNGFFWELEKIRYFGKGDNPGLLQTFLENETREIDKTGYIPAHFEYCFGPTYDKEVDPHSVPQLLMLQDENGNKIKINGKIDRIDINPKTKQAAVYDYKSGRIDGKNAQAVAKGLSFQLPVYIQAVEKLLGRELEVVYGGYYQVKDAQNCKNVAAMTDAEKYPYLNKGSRAALPNTYVRIDGNKVSFDELIQFSKETAINKQNELFQGIFNHTKDPDNKMCSSFCDYKRMCQKYVTKIKYRRNKESLES